LLFCYLLRRDIPFTIREIHRVLKLVGAIFTTGPMPENKQLFYDIIKEATGKPIPPMPGSSRYASQILSTVKDLFSQTDLKSLKTP
jgi:hypothetical protein